MLTQYTRAQLDAALVRCNDDLRMSHIEGDPDAAREINDQIVEIMIELETRGMTHMSSDEETGLAWAEQEAECIVGGVDERLCPDEEAE